MRAFLATLLLVILFSGCTDEAPAADAAPPALVVRLTRFEGTDSVTIEAAGTWRLTDATTGDELEAGSDLNRTLSPRGSRLPRALRITAISGRLRIGGRTYPGDLELRNGERGTWFLLHTDLESYLPGVLAGEMGSRFTPAALRAQAVVARTYAYSRMRRRQDTQAWHVADDTRDQVYVGETEIEALREAVERTRGMVLTWRSEPLPGYYHSTCGGHTASAAEVFGEPDLPPMVGVPCGYCTASPRFRWSPPLELSRDELQTRLFLPGPPESVEILARRRDGRVTSVRFGGPDPVEFTGEDLRFRLGPEHLRSTLIHRISVREDRVVFEGGGSGHGVGMCQWGAEGMARAGASAADILAHYSPGAVLGRIY